MNTLPIETELKLKQASVVLDMPPKLLQNFVQFRVVRPRRRGRFYWFGEAALLQAKCALYLRESLGASTEHLAGFVRALAASPAFLTMPVSVSIQSRPFHGAAAVSILVPVGALNADIKRRMPLAAVARDLPTGRRRPGWKADFVRSVRDAAAELPPLSDAQILNVVGDYRRSRSRREVTVGPES
jgi:hypothetical protein